MPQEQPKEIKITTEDEALDLLTKLLEGYKFPEDCKVEFESWPRFVIKIEGKDFNGTIPTRIMPTILELQREIHKIYCLNVYGEDNARRLTKKDKEKLELLVKVDKGSSFYDTLLDSAITKILQDSISRMSPEQITAVLIVSGLSISGVFAWKYWLHFRAKEKELDHTVELSKLEKEKMEIVQRATQQYPTAQYLADSINEVRNDLLSKLKPQDSLEVNTWEERRPGPHPLKVGGEIAEKVTRRERETSIERLIEDEFLIQSAIFSHREEFRVNLERPTDGYSFSADIPHGVLDEKQTESLKNNSWDRKSMFMKILAKELHGKLTNAKVVEIIVPAVGMA